MKYGVFLNGTRVWATTEFDSENDAVCAVMRSGLSSAYGHKWEVLAL